MNKTSSIVKEPVMSGADVTKYIAELTPQKLHEDVMSLAHDIQQLSAMMGECMKQSMATVVSAGITVHVEMKMRDEMLYDWTMGYVAEPREEQE